MDEAYTLLGMDWSDLVFTSLQLSPEYFVVEDEPTLGTIGMLFFECAGYFPRDCIRTSFRAEEANPLEQGNQWEFHEMALEELTKRGYVRDFSKDYGKYRFKMISEITDDERGLEKGTTEARLTAMLADKDTRGDRG
jgi:hypothetical protein